MRTFIEARGGLVVQHPEKASDAEFDKTFLDQQIASHREARTLLESYAPSGDDPHLRSYARSISPGIGAHARAVVAVRARSNL